MKRSRRRAAGNASETDDPGLSVAPLIDVSFLLLIYFLVTTTILPAEQDLKHRAPEDSVPSKAPTVSVLLHVRSDGALVVNPGPREIEMATGQSGRELPLLEDYLRGLMVAEPPPLLVRVDEEALHQRVVDVMNLLQKIGWTRVGFVDSAD